MSRNPPSDSGGDPIRGALLRPGAAARPAPVGEERLWAAALRYLQRFSASADMLRRVLDRRLHPAVAAGLIAEAEAARRREAVLRKAAACGYLDDARFADGRVAALLRQGKSLRAIAETLKAKGVAAETVRTALAAAADGTAEDLALAAARAYARRRRLGPFRAAGGDDPRRAEKDLAALLRAGHSLAAARRVLAEAPGSEQQD